MGNPILVKFREFHHNKLFECGKKFFEISLRHKDFEFRPETPPLSLSLVVCSSHRTHNFFQGSNTLNKELYSLLKNTNWWCDMTSVFNMMDANEKLVLASASVFHGTIPRAPFGAIFDDPHLRIEADNLCRNHCILQKSRQTAKGEFWYRVLRKP